MPSKEKVRAQLKSHQYYLFWGACTFAVMAGQIYVGTGYRSMAKSMDRWFDTAVDALIDSYRPRGLYQPLVPPPTGDFNRDQLDLTELDPDDYIIWLETDKYTISK